jgi:hypothetical protein
MAICKTCGKKYSRWTVPVSARGVCSDCFEAEVNSERKVQAEDMSFQQVAPAVEKPVRVRDQEPRKIEYPGYEMLGRFAPRDAKRILKRLKEEHLSFKVQNGSETRLSTIWLRRFNYLCIHIRPEHKEKAVAVVLEDGQL